MHPSEIKTFFENQTIFLTGGTGFLGKVIVEKLLRVCEPKKIYILVRPKKGHTTEERFYEYFNYACFEVIKKEKRAVKDKITFINGDCEQENLGISKQFEEILINETTIVIHAAANVKFDTPLRSAANTNVRSTIAIVNLAKQMSQLKAFIYVSTAYSNCPHQTIDEKIYSPPITPKQLFSILEGIQDDILLEEITPKILGPWPNTYTFTKTIAENYINSEMESLSVAIIRPAIVTSTSEEPVPGWVDNFYGIIGITLAAALGVLRSMNAKINGVALIVPCDYVANAVLAAAWDVSTKKSGHTIVYNYIGSSKNSVTWKRYMRYIEDCAWDYATEKVVWYYSFNLRENKLWHRISVFFLHTVIAHIADLVLFCIGREPLAVKNYSKLDKLVSLTTYFSLREWTVKCDNLNNLWNNLSGEDKRLFNFNMDDTDWPDYIKKSIIGGRLYLLKDPLDTIPQGKRKLRILGILHYGFIIIFFFLLYKILSILVKRFV